MSIALKEESDFLSKSLGHIDNLFGFFISIGSENKPKFFPEGYGDRSAYFRRLNLFIDELHDQESFKLEKKDIPLRVIQT